MTLLVRIKGQFESRGSAVWIGKSGYVATCYHVIKNVQLPLVVGMPHDPIFAMGNMNVAISGVGLPDICQGSCEITSLPKSRTILA
jgi:hypothetical protein